MFKNIGPFELIIILLILISVIGVPVALFYSYLKNKRATVPDGVFTDSQRIMQFDSLKRNAAIVYAMWFFLGWFGVHRMFCGKLLSGFAMLAIALLSPVLALVGVGFIGLFALGVWWVVDLFLIGGWVRDYNEDLIRKLGGQHPIESSAMGSLSA